MTENPKSVAVITSTIGRPELARAIESVKNQTYPCKHYIFVDGEQFADNAKAIVEQYDNLIVTYLPMNTGANGWVNSSINAIAPYLAKGDIICYLDDDNWYEPNHIQSIVEAFESSPTADFVYTLRNFVEADGTILCPDNFESLGVFENKVLDPYPTILTVGNQSYHLNFQLHQAHHIDTNCYAFKHPIALELSRSWFSGIHNDKNVLRKIVELNLKCVCTKQYSVNYVVDVYKMFGVMPTLEELGIGKEHETAIRKQLAEVLSKLGDENIRRYGGKRPWVE